MQNLLKSMVAGAHQSFQFFGHDNWLLKNNRALPKFWYGILHYLLVLPNHKESQSIKPNFILTMRATLRQ